MRNSLILIASMVLFAGCERGDQPSRKGANVSANNVDPTVGVGAGEDVNPAPNASDIGPDTTKVVSIPSQPAGDDVASNTSIENIAPEPTRADVNSATKRPAGEVEVISFDDLNIGMPVDSKFRPIMLQYNDGRVNDLIGKRINVGGYMNATDTLKGVKEFILLRNLECKFGPGGQADHLVHVLLQGGVETEFTDQVVYVEGVLELNEFPEDGPSTWSIYDLKATKVSTRPPPRRR